MIRPNQKEDDKYQTATALSAKTTEMKFLPFKQALLPQSLRGYRKLFDFKELFQISRDI